MMVLLPCRKKAAEAQKQLQQSSEAEQQLEGQVRGPYSPPAQQLAHRLCFPPPPLLYAPCAEPVEWQCLCFLPEPMRALASK